MVATVQIIEKNTTVPAITVKSGGTVRFKNADDAIVDTANPMVIPTGSPDFSFEKWLRFRVTVAPDTQIDNLEVYSDGTTANFGTGVNTYAKRVTSFSTLGPQEIATTTSYTGAGGGEFFTLTSASPLDMSSNATITTTGEFGDHLVMKLSVDSTASQGALTPETLTFRYDEI